MRQLGYFEKFCMYGVLGMASEVAYTSIWHVYLKRTMHLHGNSHAWAFPIYGLVMLSIELLSVHPMLQHKNMLIRAFVYALATFAIEFITGASLMYFNICPWDYSPWFEYHLYGIITLEYFPLWYVGSILVEQVAVKYLRRLRVADSDHDARDGNEKRRTTPAATASNTRFARPARPVVAPTTSSTNATTATQRTNRSNASGVNHDASADGATSDEVSSSSTTNGD